MTTPDATNEVLESESMDVPHTPLTHSDYKKYCGKLRLLSHVHLAITDKLNAKRIALEETFFRPEDRFISAQSEDLVTLMVSVSSSASASHKFNRTKTT
jgi:hypothetical protein